MSTATPAARAENIFLMMAALLAPSLSLLPLGGLYLWEKGWLLWWALTALAVVAGVVAWHRWWFSRLRSPGSEAGSSDRFSLEVSDADPRWSPLEVSAWADVKSVARSTNIDEFSSPDAALGIAAKTIAAVATRLHAGNKDAVWQFTLPEALAISERVSRRLGRFVVTHVPFGERMTVSQILTLYRARQIVDVAGKAYDVWRLVRMVNPATAVTHEARERLTKALYSWGREQVTRRLVDAYVDEVGRAAIDLYGGRLRQMPLVAEEIVSDVAAGPSPPSRAVSRGGVRQAASAVGSLAKALFTRRK